MIERYVYAFPILDYDFSMVPEIYSFMRRACCDGDVFLLIREGVVSERNFESMLDYYESVKGIVGEYLPGDLSYVSSLINCIFDHESFLSHERVEFLSGLDDVHFWMLALWCLSGDFLMFSGDFNFDVEEIAADWVFRSEFVNERLLSKFRKNELDVSWILFNSIYLDECGAQSLVLASRDFRVEMEGLMVRGGDG